MNKLCRKILSLILIVSSIVIINAADRIPVEFIGTSSTDYISVRNINGITYFNIAELNKTLNAFISIDIIDNRIFVELYGQRLIFLIDSSYLLYDSQVYSFVNDITNIEGRYFIPVSFLQRVLPEVFQEKIFYNADKNLIRAESPVDTSIHTIVIDPGHGGRDPGAIGASGRTYEKDVVLSVAKRVRKLVEDNLDVRVLLTREDNVFVPLHQRTAFANNNNANLFISLHCNAALNRTARGIETFFLSAARSDEARAVEIMENSVVEKFEGGKEALKRYDDLTFILMDMAQAEQLRESSYLALKLQGHLISKTSAIDRGVKQAGFFVLRGAYMPSVLVELGFISNPEEERKLNNSSYQQQLAEAIYEGIKSYIYNYEMFR